MTNVLNFRKRLSSGQSEFILCAHCSDETAFLPIVSRNKTGLFITELVCAGPKCEGQGTVLEIVNGVVNA